MGTMVQMLVGSSKQKWGSLPEVHTDFIFAAIFAVLFGGETLTLQALFGGLLVLTAMFLIVLREGKDGN